jgi:hypothetical protein
VLPSAHPLLAGSWRRKLDLEEIFGEHFGLNQWNKVSWRNCSFFFEALPNGVPPARECFAGFLHLA